MNFNIWKQSKSIEAEFLSSLNFLVKIFERIAKTSHGDISSYQSAMNQFQGSVEYEKYIMSAIKKMVTPIANSNMATWRKASKKATKGSMLYKLLQDELKTGTDLLIQNQIIENAALIKTLPNDVALKVVNDIEEQALRGRRDSNIRKDILKYTSQHARASAKLIARTEVSKTTTALTKARCENLDLKWYVWRTALDGNRVRKSHQIMEDVIVAWSDPPSPERLAGEKDVGNYHAGNIWNCRCYPEPLLEIDDVDWPHKVYYQGAIKRMSKNEFKELI